MKRLTAISIVALVLTFVVIGLAIAGQVYERETKALSATAGSGTWTNSWKYAAIELKRLWLEGAPAGQTVTVTRVLSDNTYTQAVGTISSAAGASASTASFTAAYLKEGDKLAFTSVPTTGATVVIEFELQKH
jgi:hypothetical protein